MQYKLNHSDFLKVRIMRHMGLFEGIGGFSLAARWAGWNTPAIVEWNMYCQSVLKKNFPDATIFGDIRKFDGRPYAGQIDIITGGFPCQPFSSAGKRAGTDDDRYLWPEMLRIVREVAPAWVVGENVAGLLSMDGGRVFSGILADLENAGYSTEVYLIPAISVGAPHRRDRVWIVAYSESANDRRKAGIFCRKDGRQVGGLLSEPCGTDSRPYANTNGAGRQKLDAPAKPGFAGFGAGCIDAITADANNHQGQRQRRNGGQILRKQAPGGCCAGNWREHWYEVATRICGIFNGFSDWMDRDINFNYEQSKAIAGQNLPYLWDYFQQEKIWQDIRGRYKILEQIDVFTVLWKYFERAERQDNLSFESEAVQSAYLRNVWLGQKPGRPSQRWEYKEQCSGEYSDTLPHLSHEITLATLEAKRRKRKNKAHRLEALGNAIVPQIAFQIFSAINDFNYEKRT